MADPVSITLGVIPLIGVAIKSYGAVYKKFSTFVDYSAKLRRLQKRFNVDWRVFENECHLLLRFVIEDDATIILMRADPAHENWADDGIDDTLRTQFGDNYGVCFDLVQDIRKAVDGIASQLSSFDDLAEHQLEGEKMKHTLRRLQDRAKFVLKESSYDAALTDLKGANSDLSRLREQLTALQGSDARPGAKRGRHSTTPVAHGQTLTTNAVVAGWSAAAKVNRASTALHAALAGAWSCGGGGGHVRRHLIKLLVAADARPNNQVDMGLAILCPAAHSPDAGTASFLRLRVRSQPRDISLDGAPPMPGRRAMGTLMPPPGNSVPTRHQRQARPAKRARVRFVEEGCPEDEVGNEEEKQPAAAGGSCDLRCSKNVCSDLAHRPSTTATECLGHIDGESFRHTFYPSAGGSTYDDDDTYAVNRNTIGAGDIVSLDKLLLPYPRGNGVVGSSSNGGFPLSVPDRLRLACQLVRAVLQFHATPWMADVWRLRDLAFFYGADEDDRRRRLLGQRGMGLCGDDDYDAEDGVAAALRASLHVGLEFNARSGDDDDAMLPRPQQQRQIQAAATLASPQPTPAAVVAGASLSSSSQMDGVLPTHPPSLRSSETGPSDGSSGEGNHADERLPLPTLLLCGIDNAALYSLGVALLQVDRWGDGAAAGPEDVVHVRKLANRPCSLGPRYAEAVRKCLRCDFGCGADLNKPRLRRAVHDGVLAQLEGMLEGLDIGAEDD